MLLHKDGALRESEFNVVYEDAAVGDATGNVDVGNTVEAPAEPFIATLAAGKKIIPFKTLLSQNKRATVTGIWLSVDDELEAALPYLPQLEVIGLYFPTFNDGRSYSSATILRKRCAFKGEVRAIGDVRVDQLEQMVRCGFDTFELAEGQDLDLARSCLKGFTFSYQHTSDRLPLFQQRGGEKE